jgi:Ig-like domain from next to BRCA1 gene
MIRPPRLRRTTSGPIVESPGRRQRPKHTSLAGATRTADAAAFLALALGLGGCSVRPTPPLFLAPTEAPPAAFVGVPSAMSVPSPAPTGDAASAFNLPPPSPTPPCTNGLSYIQDLTIPDGSNFAPGQEIDKQWQVRNSGSCNWDRRYGLKLISGDAMGNPALLPLFPARAGAQAVLEVHFTAPPSAGLYECDWRAVDPQGQPFGDAVYMQISVAP